MQSKTKAVIGAQWGDEGKGKIVDRLAAEADVVVRFQGGSNAGHTVVVDDEKYVLHLIPSGILQSETVSLVGPGVVVNLRELFEEIEELDSIGVPVHQRLRVAARAHVLLPFHCETDARKEADRGSSKIGTTQKGIGPAYVDKVQRRGLRICDLADREKVLDFCRASIAKFEAEYGRWQGSSVQQLAGEYCRYYEKLQDQVVNSPEFLRRARQQNKKLLFEGAQGTMLDLDFGTYPYVTSSNPTIGGVVTGSGFPGHQVDKIIGVTKAYTTRVGAGPFPAELEGERGEYLREKGGEFGATTGRPRRCGRLDLMQMNYACAVNGFTDLALTKLDILSGLPELEVITGYRSGGELLTKFPAESGKLEEIEPVTEAFDGWSEEISDCRDFSHLPVEARDYVNFIGNQLDIRISYVSVGPGREELIPRT